MPLFPVQRNGAVCTDPTTQICDLHLRYNFQPWNGGTYNAMAAAVLYYSVMLLFLDLPDAGNTIRFKICQRENIGEDFNITTCKEKAVIR